MQKTLLTAIVATLAGLPAAFAQPKGGGLPVQPIQQVKPGLYMVAGGGANSIVRVTSAGIILVDGKLPADPNYTALMEQIKSVSDQPVKYLIVTHHHGDHTGNDAKFIEAGAQVIGHENLKKNLLTYKFNPAPAPPTITYDKDYVVKLGGVEADVHHFGRSHTSGDSVVYFPDLKVVAVSDAIAPGAPLIDYAGGGSALEWEHVFESILALDFDSCIPGNGNPMTRADVQAYQKKFDTLISRATELVHKGVPKDQLLAQLKTDDIGWGLRVPDVGAFYDELSQSK